jgi:regulatory protein
MPAFSPKTLSDDPQQALNKLTEYLARRDHSERELRTKMARRFSRTAVERAIGEARERGWIRRPEELAEQVAEQLFRRGKGPLYVNGYLRKKGLPALSFDQEEMRELCRKVLEQKYPQWSEMSFEEKRRPLRFLLQRGFPESLILAIFS